MDESMFSGALALPNPSLFNRFMEGLLMEILGRVWGKKQDRLTENLEREGKNLVLEILEREEGMNTRRLDVVV